MKSPIATACSKCESVAVKNIELESAVNLIQEDNDYMHKLMGWLFVHEPHLSIMIAQFKRADGRSLGFEKIGECSGEREREKQAHSTPCNPQPRDQDKIENICSTTSNSCQQHMSSQAKSLAKQA